PNPPHPQTLTFDGEQLCEAEQQSKSRGQGDSAVRSAHFISPCGGIGGRAPKVLNLFAYTGGATLACLQAGAEVTHIDAAKGMNNWARDNIKLSGLDGAKHKVLTDDVLKFVKREARRGNMYDGIIMDPPVFGRGPGGEMWRLEEGLFELVENCMKLLSPDARFFLINAYTAGFSPTAYGNILNRAAKKMHLDGAVSVGEVGLEAQSGILLPCGMYARFSRGQE
ncbi:MAG: class I SAM-dependent methyltransferase, partial [Defluviitaleaceae bacterium]|nr:class I SAM-dependent methyltransferase [Defluviitaleaceae bacterium]